MPWKTIIVKSLNPVTINRMTVSDCKPKAIWNMWTIDFIDNNLKIF